MSFAKSASDPFVRREHLTLGLNLSPTSFIHWQARSLIPPPDDRNGNLQLWRLSTIRRWNAKLADDLEQLLKIPSFAARTQRTPRTPRPPLLNAA